MQVAQKAHEAGLSLTTKSFDHAYDSLNLYTWHPEGIAKILQELYPVYEAAGLYYDTPHFFQSQLEGINPDHIGFVQEPIRGWPPENRQSHSGRMRILGAKIDEFLQDGTSLTSAQFTAAATAAGVNPERPYLIAA